MTTGQLIKEARKEAGMTQAELADKLGIPYQSVSQWERNTRKPKPETIYRIAQAIGVDFLDLLGDEERELYVRGLEKGGIGSAFYNAFVANNFQRKDGYSYSDTEIQLINSFVQLNDTGQKKAVERVEELTEIPKYRQEGGESTPPSRESKEGTTAVAPALAPTENADQEQPQPEQQKMPTPVPEDGQDGLEEFVRKHKKNLTAGQEQKILEMMQAMIEPQKQPLSVSVQQTVDEKSPKNGHRGTP